MDKKTSGESSSARDVSFILSFSNVIAICSGVANRGLRVDRIIFLRSEKACFTTSSVFKSNSFSGWVLLDINSTMHDVIFGGGVKQVRGTLNKIRVLFVNPAIMDILP